MRPAIDVWREAVAKNLQTPDEPYGASADAAATVIEADRAALAAEIVADLKEHWPPHQYGEDWPVTYAIQRIEAKWGAEAMTDLRARFPLGTPVRKASGPQWQGVVVGYYASSYTPEGIVIECTAEGARGQVHVEPAKRMEIIPPTP